VSIIPFIYDEKPIRVVTDEQGAPWFVAKDLAEILGHRDAATAVRSVEDDEKGTHLVRTPGGDQELTCVSEAGLYRLMLRSDKPEAKPFQKWVVAEVLPAIRRGGAYEARPAAPRPRLPLVAAEYRAALALCKMIGIEGNAAKIAADQAVQRMGYQSPLALTGASLVNERQEVPLTPTELGRQVGLSAVAMNRRLADAGMQVRRGDTWEATDQGRPFATLLDIGKKNGSGAPVTQLKWSSSVLRALDGTAP
jgi:hypothetical protein